MVRADACRLPPFRDADHRNWRSSLAKSEFASAELLYAEAVTPNGKSLQIPESPNNEIDRWLTDTAIGYYMAAAMTCPLSAAEWHGYLTQPQVLGVVFHYVRRR
jgi:hypothetical protein